MAIYVRELLKGIWGLGNPKFTVSAILGEMPERRVTTQPKCLDLFIGGIQPGVGGWGSQASDVLL